MSGEIVEPDVIVENNDKDWDLERIMTKKSKPVECKVKFMLCRRDIAPQVKDSADIFAVFVLA